MNVVLLSCGPFVLLMVAAVLRLIALAQPETSWSGWRQLLLTRISYFLTAISLTGMVFLVFVEGPLGIVGLALAAAFAIAISQSEIRFAGVRNRSRQAELLWVLAIAVKSGRPLADEIEAYARGASGKRHRLLVEMAERLREGVPLTEIVVPQGLLPSSAAMQIHAGLSSQSLQDSLTQTATRVTQELTEDQESDFPGAGLAYPPTLLIIASLIVGFIMYWIIPKFKKIFDDFGTELPDITVMLIRGSDTIVNYWYIMGLPALVYLPLGICAFVALAEYYGWQVLLQSLLGRWFVRWHTPDVMRSLSQSIAQGIPIDQALIPIIKYAGPLKFRRRLAVAADAMEDGSPSWQSLEAAGVLKFQETVVLESAQRIGNLPWALTTLATSIERRRMFQLKAFLEFIQPAVLIPIGIIVGFIALAIFMPLIKLLNDLS